MRAARDLCHYIVVLRLARLFDEHRVIGLVSLDQQLGGGGADGAVEVDRDIHLFAHRLPEAGEDFGGMLHIGFGKNVAIAAWLLSGNSGLEGAEALPLQFLHLIGLAGVSVYSNAVARRSAQQLVHWHAEGLALDVPQGLVNAAEGAGENRPAPIEGVPVNRLPMFSDWPRIFAHQVRLNFLDSLG